MFTVYEIENSALKQRVNELENHQNDLKQHSRSNCIEVNGVPEEPNEDLPLVVKKIGEALGVTIEASAVDACHRLGPQARARNRGKIVKFNKRIVKEELLQKRT